MGAALAAMIGGNAFGQDRNDEALDILTADEILAADAKSYASEFNVTLDEAVDRLLLMRQM